MLIRENKPYWWQRCIPRYGNWGGVGWSAGRWNNDPKVTDWNIPAIDSMDACFREHDRDYQEGRNRSRADRTLVKILKTVRPKTVYGKFYKIGAMVIFTIVPVVRDIF